MEIWPVYNPDAAIMFRYLYDRMDTRSSVFDSRALTGRLVWTPPITRSLSLFLQYRHRSGVAWRGMAWRGRGDHVQKWSSFRLPPLVRSPVCSWRSKVPMNAPQWLAVPFPAILFFLPYSLGYCIFPLFFISRVKSKRMRSSLSIFTDATWSLYAQR